MYTTTKTIINEADVVKVDVPLLIRLLEYVREDVESDIEVHKIATNIIALSSTDEVLNMNSYECIVENTKTPKPVEAMEPML